MKISYGSFDGIASRYSADEAWLCGGDGWVEINSASHGNAVRQLTREEFDDIFIDWLPFPPLPVEAFRGEASRDPHQHGRGGKSKVRPRSKEENLVATLLHEIAAQVRSDKQAASAAVIEAGMREAHAVLAALPNQ